MKKPQALIGLLAALGTAIGVLVAVVGLPYGRMNYSAFAEVYHNGTNTTGLATVALDCNIATTATDEDCTFDATSLPANLKVDVTLGNETGADFILGTFNFTVNNPDATKFNHVNPGFCAAPGTACNPDFNGSAAFGDVTDTTGPPDVIGSFACSPAPGDIGTPGVNNKSFMSCSNGAGDGPTVLDGNATHLILARVTYTFSGSTAVNGDNVPLVLSNTAVFDDSFSEVGSCNPQFVNQAFCGTTTIHFAAPTPTPTNTVGPTNTPAPPTDTPTNTNTPTVTNTPTNTATATNTATPVPGAAVVKLPESCFAGGVVDTDNCDPNGGGAGFATANLWLCQAPATCALPGEGNLVVYEVASNVVTAGDIGVGAYEFQVEYDNFVIKSVNACDVVFSAAPPDYPNGTDGVADGEAYFTRGPVDQVNSSACANDPDAANNGTCNYSFVLENLVRFGCVTNGQTNSGVGVVANQNFDMARLNLIPNSDLSNDIFPGNNNGVVTVLKDTGCEIVDRLGHAELGNVNGGLTASCRDLAVTVRILEGDVNLDCDVDVTDAATIATHYGGFFGSLLYSKWLDLEPATHDLDIDIKDLQKVFGRIGSTCQDPIPAQLPEGFPAPPGN